MWGSWRRPTREVKKETIPGRKHWMGSGHPELPTRSPGKGASPASLGAAQCPGSAGLTLRARGDRQPLGAGRERGESPSLPPPSPASSVLYLSKQGCRNAGVPVAAQRQMMHVLWPWSLSSSPLASTLTYSRFSDPCEGRTSDDQQLQRSARFGCLVHPSGDKRVEVSPGYLKNSSCSEVSCNLTPKKVT